MNGCGGSNSSNNPSKKSGATSETIRANTPTIGPNNTIPFWDTNPQNPDYFSFGVSGGKIFGAGANIIISRFGDLYIQAGPSIGKAITPLSGNLTVGWIGNPFDEEYPSWGESDEFLGGWGATGCGGIVGGVCINYSKGEYYANRFSYEYGVVFPAQLGVSLTYAARLPWRIRLP